MFSINNRKIKLTRGDTATINVNVKSSGETYDYSDDTLVFTVKKTTKDKSPLIKKVVENGQIRLQPSDTSKLSYGTYKYDIQLTTLSGDVYTIIPPSDFVIDEEVTF